MYSKQAVHVTSAWHLLEILDEMLGHLANASGAYCVISVDDDAFVQIGTLEDGSLRLESSSSNAVIAAGLGFNETVEGYEHIAATDIPARWPSKEKVATETMVLLLLEVHRAHLPGFLDFELDHLEWKPRAYEVATECFGVRRAALGAPQLGG